MTLCIKMTNIMHTEYHVAKEELLFTQFRMLHDHISRTTEKLADSYASDKAYAQYV